jgi:hypothetical protein
MEELEIEKRVFLLAVAKRKEGESMNIILSMLIDTGMFNKKEGKKHLDELSKANYIVGENLSMTGVIEADKAEKEFKQ